MSPSIGQFTLSMAVVVAAIGVLSSIIGIRLDNERAKRASGWSIAIIVLLFTIASAVLMTALMQSNFEVEYVAKYTERALPVGYKFAAFWAGQSGSLLLWAWLLAVLCLGAVIFSRKRTGPEHVVANGVMSACCGFFAVLMLFAANPFTLIPGGSPIDGNGLNPMLQDPGMIIHPPLLFIGYAGFTIPFALMVGVLVAGREDNHWLAEIRRWILFSWVFLTAGIVLGAWWAYVELGWGGYWAWDPVENASLLPWFTSTALLHSMIVQQHRGMFKMWNVGLIASSFILCIFGTYLTRSGVIQSVHAFPESWVGKMFLIFLVVLVISTAGLMVWRRRQLRAEHQIEGFISREGAFLLANVLLVGMMLVTLIGTIFPLLSDPFGEPVTVKAPFYDKVVAPMGVLLAFVMAHGPVLAFGKSAASRIARDMRIPGIVAIIVTVLTGVLMTRSMWAMACTFIATLGTVAVIVGFFRVVSARHRSTGENWLAAAIRLIDADKRRYGAQITHLGMMMIVLGVACSSLFEQEHQLVLNRGQAVEKAGFTFILDDIKQFREANYTALEAAVGVVGPDGRGRMLRPQKRAYDKWPQQVNTEVALISNWRHDIYLILGGVSEDGLVAGVKLLVGPLVLWIWIGGIVMSFGGVFCMLPRLLPHAQRAPAPRAASENKTETGAVPHGQPQPSTVEVESV